MRIAEIFSVGGGRDHGHDNEHDHGRDRDHDRDRHGYYDYNYCDYYDYYCSRSGGRGR